MSDEEMGDEKGSGCPKCRTHYRCRKCGVFHVGQAMVDLPGRKKVRGLIRQEGDAR